MTDRDDSSSGTAGLAVEPDGGSGDRPEEPDIDDVLDNLKALEDMVGSPEGREQVREAMSSDHRSSKPRRE